MDIQTLMNIAVGIVVVVWIGGRQLRWRPVTQRSTWTIPLLLTAGGIVLLANEVKPAAFTALGLGFLAIELALSVAIGSVMGVIAGFRRIDESTAASLARRGDPAPEWETRTGWVGMVLWIVLIGVRIGLDFLGERLGAGELLIATGTILFVVGINRLTRSAVLSYRLSRRVLVAA